MLGANITVAPTGTYILSTGIHAVLWQHQLYLPRQQRRVPVWEQGCGTTPAVSCTGISGLCAQPCKIQIWLHTHVRIKWHRCLLVNPCFGTSQEPLPWTYLSAHWNYKSDSVCWTQAGLLITVTRSWDSSAVSRSLHTCKHTLPTLKRWRKHSLQTCMGKWMRASPLELPTHKRF